MKQFSTELTNAIESDCAHSMEPLMEAKRSQDLKDMLDLLKEDVGTSNARARALYALGRWGDPKVVEQISEALPLFNDLERASAIDALGRLGSAPALASVISLQDDPSMQVRKFVVRALSRFKGAKAAKALKYMEENDSEDLVRAYARKYATKATNK